MASTAPTPRGVLEIRNTHSIASRVPYLSSRTRRVLGLDGTNNSLGLIQLVDAADASVARMNFWTVSREFALPKPSPTLVPKEREDSCACVGRGPASLGGPPPLAGGAPALAPRSGLAAHPRAAAAPPPPPPRAPRGLTESCSPSPTAASPARHTHTHTSHTRTNMHKNVNKHATSIDTHDTSHALATSLLPACS